MLHKRSKNNLAQSTQFLIEADTKYSLNSSGEFPYGKRYIKIDNEHLSPLEVAELIREYFSCPGTVPGV